MNTNVEQQVYEAVCQASENWRAAFNRGDSAGCASAYEAKAVMEAKPFGVYNGRSSIQDFWQDLIDQGFADVRYGDVEISVLDDSSAVLSATWQMNNAKGVITKELWVMQSDGSMALREDAFEAQP